MSQQIKYKSIVDIMEQNMFNARHPFFEFQFFLYIKTMAQNKFAEFITLCLTPNFIKYSIFANIVCHSKV